MNAGRRLAARVLATAVFASAAPAAFAAGAPASAPSSSIPTSSSPAVAAPAAPAGSAAPAPLTAEELALVAAAAAPARSWDLAGHLRTAAGRKENVLLSAVRPEASAFVRTEAEVFWWRLPTERFEALAFANAAVTRFVDSRDNPREWQSFAHAEARWFATPAVQFTGVLEGYHLDQVFDLSATQAQPVVARLAVTGVQVAAGLRWQLRPRLWLEARPAVQRERYRDGADDNSQRLGRLAVGRTWFDGRLELSVSAQRLERDYVRRPRYSIGGRPLAGTDLDFAQRDAEASATVGWDRARRWTSVFGALAGDNRDSGSGYFDYRRRSVRHELTWNPVPWRLRLAGRATRYDYLIQTQGVGIAPPLRLKEEFFAQVRVERTLSPRLVLHAEYLWERSRSNDPLSDYRVRTAAVGAGWSF